MSGGTPLLSSIDARIEAALVAAGGPVGLEALTRLVPDGVDVEAALQRVIEFWQGRGMEIVAVDGGWACRPRLVLVPEDDGVKSRRLSSAAVATLAVIAMHQPVTVAQIEQVRGVKLGRGILEGLRSAGLIVETGRRRGSGQPATYGITLEFLERFDLESLSELPTPEEAFMLDLLADQS